MIRHLFCCRDVLYIIYYLSYTVFTDYLFIWIISFLLLFLRKLILSYSITIGNILGIFAGQYWGDFFQSIRMAQITIDSPLKRDGTFRYITEFSSGGWLSLLPLSSACFYQSSGSAAPANHKIQNKPGAVTTVHRA